MTRDTSSVLNDAHPFSRIVPPPDHAFERSRLDSLETFKPYTFEGDPAMLRIACHAAEVFGSEVGAVSILGERTESLIACVGYKPVQFDRAFSFCAYAILESTALVVGDATADPRFRHNPFVVGEPHIRFYAGAPILDPSGLPLGAVCVIDLHPCEAPPESLQVLQRLSEIAASVLQTRRLFAQTHPEGATEEELQTHECALDALLAPLTDCCPP